MFSIPLHQDTLIHHIQQNYKHWRSQYSFTQKKDALDVKCDKGSMFFSRFVLAVYSKQYQESVIKHRDSITLIDFSHFKASVVERSLGCLFDAEISCCIAELVETIEFFDYLELYELVEELVINVAKSNYCLCHLLVECRRSKLDVVSGRIARYILNNFDIEEIVQNSSILHFDESTLIYFVDMKKHMYSKSQRRLAYLIYGICYWCSYHNRIDSVQKIMGLIPWSQLSNTVIPCLEDTNYVFFLFPTIAEDISFKRYFLSIACYFKESKNHQVARTINCKQRFVEHPKSLRIKHSFAYYYQKKQSEFLQRYYFKKDNNSSWRTVISKMFKAIGERSDFCHNTILYFQQLQLEVPSMLLSLINNISFLSIDDRIELESEHELLAFKEIFECLILDRTEISISALQVADKHNIESILQASLVEISKKKSITKECYCALLNASNENPESNFFSKVSQQCIDYISQNFVRIAISNDNFLLILSYESLLSVLNASTLKLPASEYILAETVYKWVCYDFEKRSSKQSGLWNCINFQTISDVEIDVLLRFLTKIGSISEEFTNKFYAVVTAKAKPIQSLRPRLTAIPQNENYYGTGLIQINFTNNSSIVLFIEHSDNKSKLYEKCFDNVLLFKNDPQKIRKAIPNVISYNVQGKITRQYSVKKLVQI